MSRDGGHASLNRQITAPEDRPGPHQPNELLTVAQIRKEYGIRKTMVYELLGTGALPAKVIGKRGTRIRREDLDNWVRSLRAYQSRNDPK